jgi:lipopolysaccharide biosynthesis regulator YciM
MTPDSALLLLLLFAAAGAGWFTARMTAQRESAGAADLNSDYLEGLNFLLNEQPDKAIEVFLRMVDVDSETVETHFLLGNLFRRRGEVNRAIRLHQNIYDRGDLPKTQRNRALKALGDDYLKAGLFDRAEEILHELSGKTEYRRPALEQLVGIYEQERDWEKAIAMRDQLASLSDAGRSTVVAHYYCELAEAAMDAGDRTEVAEQLRRARAADPGSLRGRLLRARLATDEEDHRLAVRMYRQALEQDPAFASIVLPPMRACYESMGDLAGFEQLLSEMVRLRPRVKPGIAYAAIVDEGFDDPVTAACVDEFIDGNPILTDLLEILRPPDADTGTETDSIRRITRALRQLARRNPTYRCQSCGFSGGMLFWQCPTCKTWDSTRPIARFQFDATIS